MKTKLIALFLSLFSLFFIFPKSLYAAGAPCESGMIDSITYELIMESGSPQTITLTESGSSTVIYKERNNYYLDENKTQKIKDVRTVTITHSQSFLNQIALNNSVLEKNITYYAAGSCENENRSLKTIKNNSGAWNFNYSATTSDMDCIFDNQFTLELNDPLKAGDNTICSMSYIYPTQAASLGNVCQISMEPTGGATIDNPITIKANDINDEGVGIRTYLNANDVSPTLFKIKDGPGNDAPSFGTAFGSERVVLSENSNGLLDLSFPLGTLSVGDYYFEVKYEDGDKAGQNICVLSFPVVASGATPTPAQQLDASQSGSLAIDIAATIPLCESIAAGTMCGDKSCQQKCIECEDKGEVWTGIGCMPTDFSGIVGSLFTLFSGLMGGFVFLCLVSNGLKIMASRGNPEALKKGQEAITACLVGFVVLVLSILFLKIVGVDILDLPEWN